MAFTYDNAGNMTGLTRYSNLAETTVVATTTYTYDTANQMTGITDKNSGGTTLVSYGYTYDAAGRVTQEVRNWASGSSTDTLTYGYTNNNQLTSVSHTNASFTNESFTWDANGNQTGTGYTTSTGNEQTASPGYTYTYDADGNMITATNTSTGDTWTYSYDFRNRMTGAVEKNSAGTVLAQVTYTYDALDNRIGMDENGTQTWTLYDGSTPVMDFNGSGSLTMRYLNGPAGDIVDAVLARQSASGTVAWYLPDRLGTIRDLINNSGSIIDHVDYSAFGTVLDESSPSNGDRMMGFAGLERDTVTGLNLAVYRVENPGTGRWTSKDPLGFAAGSRNLSGYTSNDPTNSVDPSGLGSVWGSAGIEYRPQNGGSPTLTLTDSDGSSVSWTLIPPEAEPNKPPVSTELPESFPRPYYGRGPSHCQYENGNQVPNRWTWDAGLGLGGLEMGTGSGFPLSGSSSPGGPGSLLSDPLGSVPGIVPGDTIPGPGSSLVPTPDPGGFGGLGIGSPGGYLGGSGGGLLAGGSGGGYLGGGPIPGYIPSSPFTIGLSPDYPPRNSLPSISVPEPSSLQIIVSPIMFPIWIIQSIFK